MCGCSFLSKKREKGGRKNEEKEQKKIDSILFPPIIFDNRDNLDDPASGDAQKKKFSE